MTKHRLIAINLPQFHPFKENDEWWGKGFTEWTNVTQAKPRFQGHYQPQLPTETGFYDLRLPEARQMQADMAREAGIHGFCYYHYWFNGHRLMERPVNEILQSGKPDFPFMLCWANENWSRNWDGSNKRVLIEQHYSEEDDIAHMRYLCESVFSDSRYIRVDGKPFFVVYMPVYIPDLRHTIEVWRRTAKEYGMELYLGFMKKNADADSPYLAAGFDAAIEFLPFPHAFWTPLEAYAGRWIRLKYRLRRRWCKMFGGELKSMANARDYGDFVEEQVRRSQYPDHTYPGLTPGWDNSSRRVGGVFNIFVGNTPQLYGKWLRHILQHFKPLSEEENFVFINAWNEWAEGNHLEPDARWGRGFLDETRSAIEKDFQD